MELPNDYRPLDAWIGGRTNPGASQDIHWLATPEEASRTCAATALDDAILRTHSTPIWARCDWMIADATLWVMEDGPYAMPGWDWHVRDVNGRASSHEMCSGCNEEGLCPAHPKAPDCPYCNVPTSDCETDFERHEAEVLKFHQGLEEW